jgi:hypothetical protein
MYQITWPKPQRSPVTIDRPQGWQVMVGCGEGSGSLKQVGFLEASMKWHLALRIWTVDQRVWMEWGGSEMGQGRRWSAIPPECWSMYSPQGPMRAHYIPATVSPHTKAAREGERGREIPWVKQLSVARQEHKKGWHLEATRPSSQKRDLGTLHLQDGVMTKPACWLSLSYCDACLVHWSRYLEGHSGDLACQADWQGILSWQSWPWSFLTGLSPKEHEVGLQSPQSWIPRSMVWVCMTQLCHITVQSKMRSDQNREENVGDEQERKTAEGSWVYSTLRICSF